MRLPDSLELYVNRVAEAFVRDYYGRRSHVQFPAQGYRVLGNREYRFFTVLSTASGRNAQGQVLSLPWKARLHWKDSYWFLYSLELDGRPQDFPRPFSKRGNDPAYSDREPISEPEPPAEAAAATVAGPPQETAPPSEPPPAEMATPAAAAPAAAPQERSWTDITGKHTLVAVLLGVEKGMAKLRKSDGTELEVPLEKLCQADQEWIAAHPP